MMNEEEKPFPVRTYSKTELACLYSPGLTCDSARRVLRHWIRFNRALRAELESLGYQDRMHLLTPVQVSVIVKHLGAP